MSATAAEVKDVKSCEAKRVVFILISGRHYEMTIQCDLHLDHTDRIHEADLGPVISYNDNGPRILAHWGDK